MPHQSNLTIQGDWTKHNPILHCCAHEDGKECGELPTKHSLVHETNIWMLYTSSCDLHVS